MRVRWLLRAYVTLINNYRGRSSEKKKKNNNSKIIAGTIARPQPVMIAIIIFVSDFRPVLRFFFFPRFLYKRQTESPRRYKYSFFAISVRWIHRGNRSTGGGGGGGVGARNYYSWTHFVESVCVFGVFACVRAAYYIGRHDRVSSKLDVIFFMYIFYPPETNIDIIYTQRLPVHKVKRIILCGFTNIINIVTDSPPAVCRTVSSQLHKKIETRPTRRSASGDDRAVCRGNLLYGCGFLFFSFLRETFRPVK